MIVEQAMNHPVHTTTPQASLVEAARLMRGHDVGFLPVVSGPHVVGVLTDRDLTLRGVAEGRDPHNTRVEEIMTANVFHCFADEALSAATKEMEAKGIRRLVVLNRKMHLVGVLTLEDFANFPEETGNVGKTLSHLSG